MSESMIDVMARRLASATGSRRGVLGLGLGSILTGLAVGADEARAACRAPKKKCAKGHQCCSGKCKKGKCGQCGNGQSFCPESPGSLSATCADLQTDFSHCGSCPLRCDAGQRCEGGFCVCDETSCEGCCDGATCHVDGPIACGTGGGACRACELGQECVGGACVCTPLSCPHGCCDGATCHHPPSDSFCGSNGGACALCPGGEACVGGVCVG